jgi:CBS domain-containing protein
MGEDQLPITLPGEGVEPAGDFSGLLVRDAMHEPVRTCGPEASLRFVALTMATHHRHAVVVAGLGETAGDRPWGVVSAADVTRAVAAGAPAMTIGLEEPLVRAARLMTDRLLTHLVVVEAPSERPAGIVSTLDVTWAYADAAVSP